MKLLSQLRRAWGWCYFSFRYECIEKFGNTNRSTALIVSITSVIEDCLLMIDRCLCDRHGEYFVPGVDVMGVLTFSISGSIHLGFSGLPKPWVSQDSGDKRRQNNPRFPVLNGPFAKHLWDVRITSFKSSFFKVRVRRFHLSLRNTTDNWIFFQQSLYGLVGYSAAIVFIKLSLFLLYLRVFSSHVRTRYLIYFGLGFTSISYPVGMVYLLAVCTPRHGEGWFETWSSSGCQSITILLYTQGGVNILSDFYLLCLPMPVVWNLQLPLRKKVGLSAIFMLGIL